MNDLIKPPVMVLAILLPVAVLLPAVVLAEDNGDTHQLETVNVTADELGETTEYTQSYTTGDMKTATKMNLSVRETPQSVSVVTRTQMDDFGLNGINDVLESTTGVTVEQIETDRVYYTSRGFEISNFQLDGLGVPLTYNIDYGNADTALYDRVEVVRGASGLMSGAGNPSATINMIRKRPTDTFQSSITTAFGSWDNYRLEVDVSGQANDKLGGRLVLVQQTQGSYLDNYSQDKSVLYGVTAVELTDTTALTMGISREDTRSNSPMWGALPMVYTNGEQTDYDVSTSSSADWSFWDTTDDNMFVELAHTLNENWKLMTVYRHADTDDTAELFYQFGTPVKSTEQGMFGWPGRYETTLKQNIVDAYLTGTLVLAGRELDVVAGLSHARSEQQQDELTDPAYGFPAVDNISRWNGNIARPDFATPGSGSDFTDKESSGYVAGRFRLADPLALIAGVRAVNWESEGDSYGVPQSSKESGRLIPYAGLVYDINDIWSAYASYTETFMPQGERDSNLQRLAPTEGNSKEIGLKSAWFDGRLNGTVAVFDAKYLGLAEWETYVMNENGLFEAVYSARDFYSQGVEAELAGELLPGLEATIGYTQLDIDDGLSGPDGRAYIPKRMLRSAFSYRLPQLDAVKVGARFDWQDAVKGPDNAYEQDSYLLVDAFVSYDINKHLHASLNLNNLTDEKYLNSLNWSQAYYGAPRNVMATLTWKY